MPIPSNPAPADAARNWRRLATGLTSASLATLLAFAPLPSRGQAEDNGFLAVPDTPSGPYPGETVSAPDVTIIETDREIITEYRVRGKLYLVRIEPSAGPPYYLLDVNGDGVLDVQKGEMPDLAVPQWQIFSW